MARCEGGLSLKSILEMQEVVNKATEIDESSGAIADPKKHEVQLASRALRDIAEGRKPSVSTTGWLLRTNRTH